MHPNITIDYRINLKYDLKTFSYEFSVIQFVSCLILRQIPIERYNLNINMKMHTNLDSNYYMFKY